MLGLLQRAGRRKSARDIFLRLKPNIQTHCCVVSTRRGGAVRYISNMSPNPGQLPGLPKEGSQAWAFFSSCLHSSQRPRAQEFTFHSLGFSSRGGEAKQLKRRPGFLRACLFSPSLSNPPPSDPPLLLLFFFFSVNSIHSGKGSKKHNSCAEEK